jgi:transposase-like protein
VTTVWGTMLFPIDDLLDETACYELLLSVLHPKGLRCPEGHALPADQAPHDRHRAPVMDYRCRDCGKVFNVFTGTPLQGVRFPPGRLILILRGFCQGVTTQHLAQELDLSRRHLMTFRHRVQGMALERFSPLSTARSGRRGRRNVPERRRERATPSRSR